MTAKRILVLSAGTLLLSALQITAGTFTANFNDGTAPAGSAVAGHAVIEPTGGVADSGVLKLTKAIGSQQGAFLIEDLDAGIAVNGFDLKFKVLVGGGTTTPADGFSVSIGSDVPAPPGTFGEAGAGSGLIVSFDTYDNAEGAPEITLHWGNSVIRDTPVPISFIRTTNEFVDVNIRLDPDGTIDVFYKGTAVYTDVPLPGFQPIAAPRYGLGARTGGATDNHWVDDIQLTTTTGSLAGRFTTQPFSATIREGAQYTFRSSINDPNIVTGFQWQQQAPGAAVFTDIAGATDTNFTAGPFTLAQSGTQFRLRADTLDASVFSSTATVSVVSIAMPAAEVTYNFNDGMVPPGANNYGSAMVTADGGVDGTGVLRLTEAVGSQGGTFIINDLDAGQAIGSMTATFKARVGRDATGATPADGFSFNWANDLPNAHIGGGEEGGGSGLTVAFDIFNGTASPTVDVKFAGTNVASVELPLHLLETDTNFVDVIIQMHSTGAVDVVYNNVVLHNRVPVPGWSALGNGRFGFAGRTGGLSAAQYIDDIGLSTTPFAGSLSFIRHPASTTNVVGSTVTLISDVNDPARATFQWQRQAPGGTTFTNIPGATNATLAIPATAADTGARYRVVATGPGGSVPSQEATLTILNVARPASPTALFDFNDCVAEPCTAPAGTAVYGTAVVAPGGGPGTNGLLRLTVGQNDQNGAWIIGDLNTNQAVGGLTVAFDAYVDGGNPALPPADGYSFSWGTDIINNGVDTSEAEEGSGTGLIVAFDLWDSGGGEAPAIDIKWRGATVAHRNVPITTLETGEAFKEVLINLDTDGTVDVVYGGELIHHNVTLTNFTPLAGARFAFAGRTGGANENQFFDNVAIQTTPFTGPIAFTQEPATNTVILAGTNATLTAAVNDPARTTFQWQRNAGSGVFTNIPGATSATLATPTFTVAESGAEFRLIATATSNTLTSRVARVTVITIPQPTPTASFDFNDGMVPPGSTTVGTAIVDAAGGVDGSGVLKLTSVGPGTTGSFVVTNDLGGGAPVFGMTTSFDTRIGGSTEATPADGMSFVWARDISTEAPFGEDGTGSGLIVTFDIFDNGGGEAPAIDVSYRNTLVASTKVPFSFLHTGDAFVPTIIRVENDGTLDVVYDNNVVYHNLQLPGFTNVVGGRFGWGARTGGFSENQWIDNIQIAISTNAAPRLTITRSANNITVTWAQGRLQSAPEITGPWTDVTGATGGSYTAAATGDRRFFRTVSP